VVAQMLGVAARNVGSEVFLPNSAFTVGIPCGGLRSAIAILSLGTLWAYIVRGGAWARGLLVLAAIPLALAANTLRIALIFVIANAWGAQAGVDFHAWSSPLLFGFAFVLLLIFARAIGLGTIRWEILFPQ
ncbi:MAG: archaeosortase/exosortase family protein, partial [Acidobacteriota bacterium]